MSIVIVKNAMQCQVEKLVKKKNRKLGFFSVYVSLPLHCEVSEHRMRNIRSQQLFFSRQSQMNGQVAYNGGVKYIIPNDGM